MVVYPWIMIRLLSYINQLTSEEAKIIQGKFKMYLNTHLHRLPHGRSQGHPTVQNPLASLSLIHPLPLHLTVPSRHLVSSFQIVSFYQQHPFGTLRFIRLFWQNRWGTLKKSVDWTFTGNCQEETLVRTTSISSLFSVRTQLLTVWSFAPAGKTENWRESWEGGSHFYPGLIHNRLRWTPRHISLRRLWFVA